MSDTDPPTPETEAPPEEEEMEEDDHAQPSESTEMRTISPRVQAIWGIRALAGVVFVALVVGVAGAAFTPLPGWVWPALGVGLAAVALVWVRLRYRVWAFRIRPDELYLERGVLVHVRTVAPFVRIQHVDTQRGPLERAFGLSTLVVYTAGSRGADVSIPGLDPAEARRLQARLKELAVDAEGGDAV